MKFIATLVLLLSLILSFNVQAEETEKVWYCDTPNRVGLRHEDNKWKTLNFVDKRFKAKQINNTFVINYREYPCKRLMEDKDFILLCSKSSEIFNINTRTGNAVMSNNLGWLLAESGKFVDDLTISAVKCEKF